MKEILNLFKKPVVVIILGLLFTIAIAGSIGYFFILPQFTSLSENQKKTADLTVKLADLTKNINAVKSVDQEELSSYSKILTSFLPESSDYLHFATLNDSLAAAAGLKVTSFTVSTATKTSVPAATASGSTGGSPASAKAPAAPASSASSGISVEPGYSVVVAYSGGFDNIENLLKNLRKLDRAVGVNHAIFSGATSELSVSLTYFLPLSSSGQASASSDQLLSLSASDKVLLNNLTKSVEFSAAPATETLGKPNPFQ